jgi:hypothetical protein
MFVGNFVESGHTEGQTGKQRKDDPGENIAIFDGGWNWFTTCPMVGCGIGAVERSLPLPRIDHKSYSPQTDTWLGTLSRL